MGHLTREEAAEAMPGPAPKPVELRVLHGDKDKSRTQLSAPQPRALSRSEAPDWMDDEARAVWNEVVADLEAMGVLTQADTYVVATFVQAFQTFSRAAKFVQDAGPIIKGRNGNAVRNPAVAVQRDSANLLRLIGRELGMSPAARTMMSTRPSEDDVTSTAARYLEGP